MAKYLTFVFIVFFSASLAFAQQQGDIKQAPVKIKPGDVGIGKMVPDFEFESLDGKSHQLSKYSYKKATVVVLTGTGCPLCLKFAPTLARLEKKYSDKNVQFLFVNPTLSEKQDKVEASVKAQGYQSPYVRDKNETIIRALGAKTTTEAFVIDRARTLVYRGAVNDQYGIGYTKDEPSNHYLEDAIDSLLAGERIEVAATTSPGCDLYFDKKIKSAAAPKVTYHNRISRIIQNNCLECHREGGPSPFSLAEYDEVKDYAGMIANVVKRGTMPPWFAEDEKDPKTKQSKLHWANDRSLSEADKRDLLAWLQNGIPEGDSADAPAPRKFADSWTIGKPDDVFEFDKAEKVIADGFMPYINVVVDPKLDEDKWVQAIEIRPGVAEVVHHVLVLVMIPDGQRERGDGIDYWAAYVPGNATRIYPKGFARRLPKGSKLVFQMHYTPNGKATEDLTKMGVVYTDKPEHEVRTAHLISEDDLLIPAGKKNVKIEALANVQEDIFVIGYLPHHHLRGTSARYELMPKDEGGKPETLLNVPQYDFNWQLFYQYAENRLISKGSKLRYTATYDNSKDNPAISKKDSSKNVYWGEQTYDEMHLGYIEYYVPGAKPGTRVRALSGSGSPNNPRLTRFQQLERYFGQLDIDNDSYISKNEILARRNSENWASNWINERDSNQDGKVDAKEFAAHLLKQRRK